MRALCVAAAKNLGQTIVVENKAGASGMLGLKAMASAKPDGYTIGQIPISVARFSQLGTVQIDPMKDLTFIARTSGQTFGIAVRADAPWKTLKEFVAAAKASPGKVTYGSAGIGGATHVGMEEFALAAGVQFNHIPYKGGAPALQDLMGGQIDALADSSSWAPHVKAGKLRLLATWGEKRTRGLPRRADTEGSGLRRRRRCAQRHRRTQGPRSRRSRSACAKPSRWPPPALSSSSACDKIDAPLMYLDGPDYEKYVAATYRKETVLIERLKLKELMAKG